MRAAECNLELNSWGVHGMARTKAPLSSPKNVRNYNFSTPHGLQLKVDSAGVLRAEENK